MGEADLQSALFDLSHQVGSLRATVDTVLDIWKSQEANATTGRRELHQKMEVLSREVAILSAKVERIDNKVETVIADVAGLKPSVQSFENAKQQVAGARMLGNFIRGCLLFVCGGIPWIVAHLMTAPKIPPH